MQPDFTPLAILWSVGLLSLSVAFSAKGPVKTTLSYLMSVLIIGLSITLTTLQLSSLTSFSAQPVAPVVAPVAVTVNIPEPTPEPEPKGTAPEVIAEYQSAAIALLEKGQKIAGSIKSFPLSDMGDISDSQYETRMSRAKGLRAKAGSIIRSVKKLEAPPEMKNAQSKLLKASESLRTAGSRLASFFNADNEDQEYSYRTQAKRSAKAASAEFNALLKKLQ